MKMNDEDNQWLLDRISKSGKKGTTVAMILGESIKERKKQHGKAWMNYRFPPGKDKILHGLRDLQTDRSIIWENPDGGRGRKARIRMSAGGTQDLRLLGSTRILEAYRDLEELAQITQQNKTFSKTEFVKFVMVADDIEGATTRYMREGRLTFNRRRRALLLDQKQKDILARLDKIREKQRSLDDYRLYDSFEQIEKLVGDILRMPAIITDKDDNVLKAKIAALDSYLSA